jgi:predicted HicB family RNase H-like nuclease
MAETTRKPTNKAKFSLYLDKTLMEKIAKISEKKDRSVNYVVEKALSSHFFFYPKE